MALTGSDWALKLEKAASALDLKQYVKVYYVDNVGGAAGASGESWDTALTQIGPAVTLWEAFRAAQTNIYGRGAIFVRGTGTAYTALTALPNYCDLIGLGADPRGNGTGIACVTAATGIDTVTSTGVRGLNVYNMQFTGSGTGWAMNLAVCYRSVFENCAFVNKATGALQIVTGGGITIRNCQMGGDTVTPAIGLNAGTGANFNQCLVERNCIYGSVTGIGSAAGLQDGTVFRENMIYGGTTGVLDTSAQTSLAGLAWYVGNFISGADAMALTNVASRAIGNHVVNTTTGAVETSGS